MSAKVAALKQPPVETAEETPFYIPATEPATRPRRTLKYGDTFAVLDSFGDIGATPGTPEGVYHADTRFLSRLELLIDGLQPLLLGSNVSDDNMVLAVDLTNPDMYVDGKLALPKDTLHIVRTLFLWRGVAYQRLAVRNHGSASVAIALSLGFGADFADLFEVRGMRRARRGVKDDAVAAADRFVTTYTGLDGRVRRTELTFDPAPDQITRTGASYRLTIPAGEARGVFLAVCFDKREAPASFYKGLLHAHRELRRSTHGVATVATSNDVFNEVLRRSMADLYMLMTATQDGPYPYAGTPWYSTTFGRDGLLTALQMLWFDPSIARGVLRRLARLQAQAFDAASDAEPGKILHEMRSGEMAALREVPFGLYYGSVDSTPLFVLLAGSYAERTGDWRTIGELWPAIEGALGWIDGPGDPDGDGFIEYRRASDEGLANQGWKDSVDSVFHADGSLADGPIALVEVQAYVYAAKRLAANCARKLGHRERAQQLEAQTDKLADRFERAFWCPQLDTYALALDGRKRPCRVRTSNAGHALFAGIASPERARLVGRGLLHPRFFSRWGVRTVSRDEIRYNPMSYHNGSVWPHDNALIALGLARYGLGEELEQVFAGIFDAATYMDLRRLPELYCGFPRRRGRGPTLYPVACAPQAWASGTPFTLVQAALGLEFDVDAHEIRLRNPRLPCFLTEIRIRGLQLGGSVVDLAVHREGDNVAVQVLNRSGSVRVSTVYS